VRSAIPLAARTSPETAVVVARALYLPASTAVLATPSAWQDALPAAALAATLGQPLLYVGASALPPQVGTYLDGASASLDGVLAFGRPRVPGAGVLATAARLAAGRAAP
jgi:ell wall binding domain 2 (CWB2)